MDAFFPIGWYTYILCQESIVAGRIFHADLGLVDISYFYQGIFLLDNEISGKGLRGLISTNDKLRGYFHKVIGIT